MQIKDIKKLSVRLYGKEVGILEDFKGKMRFKYNKNAEYPLSLSLPIRDEVYPEKLCKSYFGGLLPENEGIRRALAVKYKINENNDFSLLAAIGHDCAGAVSFQELNEPQSSDRFIKLQGDILTDTELEQYIKDLPINPYQGRRLSLAGVQEKSPVCVIDGKIALPIDDSPTTHILKPALRRFKESVENEFICMQTARSIGLRVPEVEIRKTKETKYFLIKRFDRFEKAGKIMRLQHEDFTQALGIWTKDKYKVTFKDCLNVLNQMSQPAVEKKKFISLAIFNYLIGNCDAHGKNFSVLYLDNGLFLSPVYDVLCTCVYDLDNDMAMKIGKARYIQDVTQKDWFMFSKQLEAAPILVIEELERQLAILPEALEKIVNKVNSEIGNKILEFVKNNCEKTKKALNL